jgi:MFS family permease
MTRPAVTGREEYARGWTILLASALGAGSGVYPLVFYSLGALIGPLGDAFGWTRAQVAAAPLFFTVASLLAGTAVGGLADRYGARRIILISQVLLVLGLLAMTRIGPGIATLYAGYFALAILGAGTMAMTWARAVTGWFVISRGLALGISLIGTGLIGAALPSMITLLIAHYGWQAGYWGLALVPLVLGIPVTALFFRDAEPPQPATVGIGEVADEVEGMGFREAVTHPAFRRMTFAFFLAALAISAVMVNILPILVGRGIARNEAAALASLIGIAVTAGRLVSGYLLDRIAARKVGAMMFLLPALACVLLAVSGRSIVLGGVSIALIGLAGGAEHDIAGYFTARQFGRRHYAAIYGLLYTIYCVGSGIGPLIMGYAADRLGSDVPALAVLAATFLLAALVIGTLRPSDEPCE